MEWFGWVKIIPGSSGQSLVLLSSVPTWVNSVPGAPTNVTVVAGNAQATVSFTAPSSNGGNSITGYTVASSPGYITNSGLSSPITVTGLSNGSRYTFIVFATNAMGNSSASVISSAVTPDFTCGSATILDRDGNSYNTVSIGDQCWLKENLKVTTYNNGTAIPDETNNNRSYWAGLITGARTENLQSSTYVATYGYLYNWYAVTDSRKICPTGWHVPSDGEWSALVSQLGTSNAGDKMRLTGTTYWTSPNTGATNESGFSALPGGYRYNDGDFGAIRNYAFFWSATVNDTSTAWYRDMYYNYSHVYRWYVGKSMGASVRCLKD